MRASNSGKIQALRESGRGLPHSKSWRTIPTAFRIRTSPGRVRLPLELNNPTLWLMNCWPRRLSLLSQTAPVALA
jgi:hypothetical protein